MGRDGQGWGKQQEDRKEAVTWERDGRNGVTSTRKEAVLRKRDGVKHAFVQQQVIVPAGRRSFHSRFVQ